MRDWARELGKGKITEAVTFGSSDFIQEGCDIDVFVLCRIRKITLTTVGKWRGGEKICSRVKCRRLLSMKYEESPN